MLNSSSEITDRLKALVTEIEAGAYARGQADARKELLDLLAGETAEPAPAKAQRGGRAKKAEPGAGRAPRGAVPRFVEANLRDHPGSTVKEILERAATDTERSIKLASIRNELQSGRKRGKCESNGRQWSLAASDPGAKETGEPASSAASSDSEPGGNPSEGAPDDGPSPQADAASEPEPTEGERKSPLGLAW